MEKPALVMSDLKNGVELGNSVCCLAKDECSTNLLRHRAKISSALEMDNCC